MQQGPKSARTRARLKSTAFKLFREDGFSNTTLRAIASESGLSLGSAYYYVESKDDLARELFDELVSELRAGLASALAEGNTLEHNLRTLWDGLLDAVEPYPDCGVAFLRSRPTLPPDGGAAIESAIDSARPQAPLPIRQDLPKLVGLVTHAILAFWASDTSPGKRRSRLLVRRAAPLTSRVAVLSRLPVVRTLLDELLGLVRAVAPRHAGS
ncbi:TetR family transcriptional regulator [Zhihengliuella salsuginis]|uniref:TetR family transcriptional regulator n=1 Tax=Zhihengliuella salsuginis TaxID=578222 RepID=A0ABQ3GCF0_9MICC|nr:TetR family transcriptional regulator [Zhihengliuella salsuginis]